MKKLLTPLVLSVVLLACSKEEIEIKPKQYSISIDSVLTRDGTKSLPKDLNGFYHLKLTPNSNQQSHRIIGKILVDGKEPIPAENMEWESNLYWWLRKGDTVTTITEAYVNYFTGQYTIINLPPMISNKDELVPTVNKSSYSGKRGEINTIISPISEMVGDTMIVKSFHSKTKTIIYTKIVLE